MMLPLVLGRARLAASRSFWHRRQRATFLFVIGYCSTWAAAGALVSLAITALLVIELPPSLTSGIAFGVAAAWQLTRTKKRALCACHRTIPLRPNGWHADYDCFRYGNLIGMSCFVSCSAMMLACALAGHYIFVMLSLATVGLVERRSARPNHRMFALIIVTCGVASCLLG